MKCLSLALTAVFCLLCVTFNPISGKVPSKYTDWYGRHKFFPWVDFSRTYNGYAFKSCFNSAEFVKWLELNVDISGKKENITAASGLVVSHDDQAIIIAFRPTVGGAEMSEEIATIAETASFPGGGTVSKFFYNAMSVLWNGGIKDAYLTSKNKNPTYEVVVVGTSMGAALAALMAPYLVQMKYAASNNVKLVTFGEPRNGHKDFADKFPSLVPYAYRVVHRNDDIPHIVPTALGYQHHKNEIWYNNAMAEGDTFVECDAAEDMKCSNSVPSDKWTDADHRDYFNKEFACVKGPGPSF